MSATQAARSSEYRADEMSELGDIARIFFSFGSPRTIAASLLVVGLGRLALGAFGWFDLILAAIVLVLAGPVEWVIHRALLHAPEDSSECGDYKRAPGTANTTSIPMLSRGHF